MDIIDVTPGDLWLRGGVFGGAVLDGWTGPVSRSMSLDDRNWKPVAMHCGAVPVTYGGWQHCRDEACPPLRIDCRRPEVRDRLRRVLAAGERCEACGGSGRITGRVTWPDADCERCNGTGYTRQPHDLGHFIDAEIAGRITPQVAAGLWWCSALRVEAGLGPVVGPATCGSEDASALLDSHRLSVAHYALYSPNRDHILLPLPDRIARLRLED